MDKQTNINFYTSSPSPILSPVFTETRKAKQPRCISLSPPSILSRLNARILIPTTMNPGRKLRIIWSSNYATRKRARRGGARVVYSVPRQSDGLVMEREGERGKEGRVKGPAYWQSVTLYDATRANHPISIHISIS